MRPWILIAGPSALLFLASAASAADPYEPNDDAATATAAGKVGFARGPVELPADDEDWYRFFLPSSAGSLVAEVSFDDVTWDTVVALELWSGDGAKRLASAPSAGAGGVRSVSLPSAAAGQYFVRVAHVSGADLPEYTLRTTRDNDDDESNEVSSDAADAGHVGFVRSGRVLLATDADWYRFVVPEEGSRVTAEVTFDAGAWSGAPALEVRSASGTAVLAQGAGADGRWTAHTGALDTGAYLIRVAHTGGGDVLDYTLRTWRDDNADEPNDTAGNATWAGRIGFRRADRVLGFDDVDAYDFAVPPDTPSLDIALSFDSAAHAADVVADFVVVDSDDVETPVLTGVRAPFRETVAAPPGGVWRAYVRHVGGDAVSSYAIQAHAPIDVAPVPAIVTTAGAPVELFLSVSGGIEPYRLEPNTGYDVPAGLAFDGAALRIAGTARTAGRYVFVVSCADSGSPVNRREFVMTMDVNPALELRVGEFLAFPAGRTAARPLPVVGGTASFVVTTLSGALPAGVTIDAGHLSFAGAATLPESGGSVPFAFGVTDAAGLSADAETTCVVCAEPGAVTLGGGPSAAGVWVDAVRGSAISARVTTVRGSAKRALRAVVLGPDGTTSIGGAASGARGTVVLRRAVAPVSGRYFIVIASADGPEAEIDVTPRVTPPRSAGGRFEATGGNAPFEVSLGALEGATLVLTVRSLGGGPAAGVQSLVAPDGTVVAVDPADVRAKGRKVTATVTLPQGGTWRVLLPNDGAPEGSVTWTAKLVQPKGGTWSAD
ncbi:MAG: hypothetical protein HMLKMBBP_02772 [Planctomycetes bacterium]|nr:hypothetical protein [Planctomycetota bacterium]